MNGERCRGASSQFAHSMLCDGRLRHKTEKQRTKDKIRAGKLAPGDRNIIRIRPDFGRTNPNSSFWSMMPKRERLAEECRCLMRHGASWMYALTDLQQLRRGYLG